MRIKQTDVRHKNDRREKIENEPTNKNCVLGKNTNFIMIRQNICMYMKTNDFVAVVVVGKYFKMPLNLNGAMRLHVNAI